MFFFFLIPVSLLSSKLGLLFFSPCWVRVVRHQVSELLGLFKKIIRVGSLAKKVCGCHCERHLGLVGAVIDVKRSLHRHFRRESFAWRLRNREKFETWPKSRVASRVAA